MRTTKTVTIPETTREVVDKISCDFCKEPILQLHINPDRITIERIQEDSCGIEDNATTYDCCPKCWTTKVVAAFSCLGATTTVKRNYDY